MSRDTSREATIAAIRAALKARSGKAWSVTGGSGTARGWITIDAPPARRTFEWDGVTPGGCHPSLSDRQELGRLLGLDGPVHPQGVSVPASLAHRLEYIDRAEGRTPAKIAEPYWD